MCYVLKHFDNPLLKFNLSLDPINGWSVNLLELNETQRHLLPLDLEVSSEGILKWLQRRFIPKNRAFVHSFLAKLGLNNHDIKGILEICKGLSLFEGRFSQYNLYTHPFNRALGRVIK